MIKLIDVRKGFNLGKPNEVMAINGITLSLATRQITVLKGPSGSGKTTILSLIGCMARPTSGRITLGATETGGNGPRGGEGAEIEVTSLPERFLAKMRCQTFGFIFQQFNLIKGISVLENVMLPAYPLGKSHGVVQARARGLLDALGLGDRTSARVEWLSGGEAQRVAMARALMNDPTVVIADEPTAHLDSKLSLEFMDIASRLKDEGRTVIIASHDPLVYTASAVDRVISLRDGMIEGEEQ